MEQALPDRDLEQAEGWGRVWELGGGEWGGTVLGRVPVVVVSALVVERGFLIRLEPLVMT